MPDKLYHIGRDKFENQIYIKDESVSSLHAQLIFSESNWILIDLKSSNGTFINNEKITAPKKIKRNNDTIKFGKFITTKSNLLDAVRKYEFEKKKNPSCSVPVKGKRHVIIEASDSHSFKNHEQKENKEVTININHILYGCLILASLVIIIGGTIFFANQSNYKGKSPDDTEIAENDEDSDDDEKDNKKKKKKKKKKRSKKQKKIDYKKYNFSCYGNLDNDIVKFGQAGEEILLSGVEVSLSDEVELGKDALEDYRARYSLSSSSPEAVKLQKMVDKLVSKLAKPRGFNYKVYYIKNSKTINATTCGGYIFFYKGMYDFCESDSELAAVLAHEIAHNELGHFEKKAQKKKIGLLEVDWLFKQTVGGVFSQKEEAECDLFGIDLVYPTNYKACSSIKLWERMEKKFGSSSYPDFFGTHPSSKKRASCIEKHLEKYYNKSCD